MRRLIRWQAVAALAFFVAVFALLWALFADRLIRETTEEAASKALGAEVDIGRFRILETQAAVEMGAFQLADPFDRGRNLVEFDSLRLDIDPVPLADYKLVVENATLTGLRFNVPRRTPAREYQAGLAQNVMGVVKDFTRQFDVPPLSLLPVDTVQAVIRDPSALRTVQAANAFTSRADTGKAVIERGVAGLRLEPALDSAKAIAARTARVDLRDLAAARRAASDLRRGIDSLNKAKDRVAALERTARGQLDSLNAGLRALEAARQQDYAFARSLLKLPSFSGPDLSRALFGAVSIDRFQQALYWTQVARQYAPPGLLPRQEKGPTRLRRAGTTVRFPIAEETPGFLVKQAVFGMSVGGAESRAAAFRLTAQDITSDPTLTRRPMTFRGLGNIGADVPVRVDLGGALDHTTQRMRDSATATVQGIPLPDFQVPGLPFRADLSRGTVGLDFRLDGDRVAGRWSLSTKGVTWGADSARALNAKEQLLARVLDGVKDLDVHADLGGTLQAPTLSIASNLGDVMASQMRRIVGEEAAKAEAKLRAQVDAAVGPRIAEARSRVAALQAQVDDRVKGAQAQLDAQKKALQDRLSGIRIPGL
ncbi:MAG TPA: hypothetical protein VG940_02460 [Gemmatimonadales bacterium]|nr:hypothetical protein [Gemmatimonadales bacterium]